MAEGRGSMKLLLTGGTGFFGRALLRHFIANGLLAEASVVVLSRDPSRFLSAYPFFSKHQQISFLQCDIQQPESLPWSQHFTHVLHAATDSTTGPTLTPLQRYDQIVDGTRNILDLAVSTGAYRFLLTSSGGIYGPQPADLDAIPEDWLGSPPLADTKSAYSQAKRAAEHLSILYGQEHSLEVVIARGFAFIGKDLPLDVHFAIGNFIRDAIKESCITVSGDGTPLRTFMAQEDLAQWLLTMLEHGRPGEAYNVGSNEVISISDLAYLVRDTIAPRKPVHIQGDATLGASRSRYIPDIRKAQNELSLMVSKRLREAVAEFRNFNSESFCS
jgi:UDP-glucuronate decarboxylase